MPARSRNKIKKKSESTGGLDIIVDGETYRYDPDLISWEQELELFQATRLSRTDIFAAFATNTWAPVLIAGIVFLARRSNGERVTFKQVADAIDYTSEIDVKILGQSDDDVIDVEALPEGPAAD